MLCLLPLMLATPQQVVAQTQQRIEVRGVLGSGSVRDDTLVPLAFTGPALAIAARYGLVSGRHMVDAELRFDFGVVLNRFGHLGAVAGDGLDVSYAHALVLQPERIFALGGALRFDTRTAYLAEWDDSHGYWLATLALWPQVIDAQPIADGTWLESRYQLALFGLASRPPSYRYNTPDALPHPEYWFDRIGDGTRVVSLGQLQAFDVEVLARFRAAGAAFGQGWGVGLSLRFARATFPEPYAQLYAGVLVTRGWSL